ncbi:MAG TPA: hypothetical protein VK013_09260 [Myxococcaceae bacterium]|nr:hypothetical protein [Myxococcaceae bacterium]
MRWWVLVGVVLALSGCVRNPCDARVDPSRCEGNVRWVCPPRGLDQRVSSSWQREDCAAAGNVCAVGEDGGAWCATSTEPHPACAGGVMRACASDTRALTCREGLAVGAEDCLRCLPADADDEEPVVHCEGGRGDTCEGDADCLPSLACDPQRGFCL